MTVLLLTAMQDLEDNLIAGLPRRYNSAQLDAARREAMVACFLLLSGLLLNFFGIFTGATLFELRLGLFYVTAHSAGTAWLSFFMLEGVHFKVLWYMVSLITLPATVLEIFFQLLNMKKRPIYL
ncbi:hypothetical protein H9P43_006227 [Blastocladiella emersonii ATCC 22665]|nr:hypothetical protein H9P43_006227 [Blastocladiella emersonii ATCC 22665]